MKVLQSTIKNTYGVECTPVNIKPLWNKVSRMNGEILDVAHDAYALLVSESDRLSLRSIDIYTTEGLINIKKFRGNVLLALVYLIIEEGITPLYFPEEPSLDFFQDKDFDYMYYDSEDLAVKVDTFSEDVFIGDIQQLCIFSIFNVRTRKDQTAYFDY